MAKLLIISGAGLSAESGISTFRDSDGLWEKHRIEDVCNGATWRANFELVHQFYNARRAQLGTVNPNDAHRMIARWQSRYDTILLTQNVDDLLERAGCREVVHLHGFLTRMCCVDCGHCWDIGYVPWKSGACCVLCPSVRGVRPDIVFFGEQAPNYAVLWRALDSLRREDVLLVIGTSGVVLPITQMAQDCPSYRILNNLARESAIDEAVFDQVIHQPATQAAAAVDRLLKTRLG
ncbi:MAG: Sir2 family NAD-dependent protein deacetylase [Verrucomicrobiota bacterium]